MPYDTVLPSTIRIAPVHGCSSIHFGRANGLTFVHINGYLKLIRIRASESPRMTAYSPKQNAERLLQLSNEVSRIAGTLAQLSSQPDSSPTVRADLDLAEVSSDNVMRVIRARRLRSQIFPDDLFADPAWDMMLDLFHAEVVHRRVSVSSLCMASGVPATTALRWLTSMVERELFVRRADPHDGRRVFVELAPKVSDALRQYFVEIADTATL
jgi:hypothetical protein